MKKILLSLLFLPLLCGAEEVSRDQMVKLEMTWQALNVIDAAETLYFIHRDTTRELNPILGPRPSPIQVIGLKTVAGFAHYYFMDKLYDYNPVYAKRAEYFTIFAQGMIVGLNFKYVF